MTMMLMRTQIGAIIIAWVNTGIIDGGHGMITIGGERVIPMERFNSLFHHILYYQQDSTNLLDGP